MTNKEAITYLEWLSDIDFTKEYPKYPIVTKQEQVEALQMAITALQVQDKLQDVEYMCRLSGGADYFRVFAALLGETNKNEQLNNLNDGVENANPNSTNEIENRVTGMTACRVPEVAKDTNVHINNCISRQATIDIVWEWFKKNGINGDRCLDGLRQLPSVQPDQIKYEYHYDHTDCIWYRPEARNRCPVTCAQYRDGWNDAMNYIFRDGKGYRPYRRDEKYE